MTNTSKIIDHAKTFTTTQTFSMSYEALLAHVSMMHLMNSSFMITVNSNEPHNEAQNSSVTDLALCQIDGGCGERHALS